VDALGSELGHGWRSARLVESLLLEVSLTATSRPTLVSRISRDTHGYCLLESNLLRGLYVRVVSYQWWAPQIAQKRDRFAEKKQFAHMVMSIYENPTFLV